MISYNYDCPGTNLISYNLFTWEKITKHVLGFRPGNVCQGQLRCPKESGSVRLVLRYENQSLECIPVMIKFGCRSGFKKLSTEVSSMFCMCDVDRTLNSILNIS